MTGLNVEGVVVQEGYDLLAYIKINDSCGHAIIDRHTTFGGNNFDRYVVCHYYDPEDGTWGQGGYHNTYRGAMIEFGSICSRY